MKPQLTKEQIEQIKKDRAKKVANEQVIKK